MKESEKLLMPNEYTKIISQFGQQVDFYNFNLEPITPDDIQLKLAKHHRNAQKISALLNTSYISNDQEEYDMTEIKEWLNTLTNDQQLFQKISDETSFSVNSPYSLLKRLIEDEREKSEKSNTSTKSEKEQTPFESMFDNEKENLRAAQYTQSMFTYSKDLFSLQNEVHQKLKAESILKMEDKATSRLENRKKMLKLGIDNRNQTNARLTQQLKEAMILYNNNLESHKMLNNELHKLENHLLMFQTKMSFDVIEKAKKCNFLEHLWLNSKQELRDKILKINDQIRMYRNKCDGRNELINQTMKNDAEYRRAQNSYDEIISSLNQDFVTGQYLESNALQILEKDMIHSQNVQKAAQSKLTQNETKKASTMFSRLFSKYVKEKQSLKNNFEKILKKNSTTFNIAIQTLNEYKQNDTNVFKSNIQQLFDEMRCIITDYQEIFKDQFQTKAIKHEDRSKNTQINLQCRKERIEAKIASRNIELSSNLNSIKMTEGIITDVLQIIQNLYQNEQASKEYSNFINQMNFFIKNGNEIISNLNNFFEKYRKDELFDIDFKSLKRSKSCWELKNDLKDRIISERHQSVETNDNKSNDDHIRNIPHLQLEDQQLEKSQSSNQFDLLKQNNEFQEKLPVEPSINPSPRFSQSKDVDSKFSNHKIDENKQEIYEPQAIIPPSYSEEKKKNKRNIRNKIKDKSPRFSQRKPRNQRSERHPSQIAEERNASIRSQAEQSLRKRIEPIPKIPFVKSADPKVMQEIDAIYSYSPNALDEDHLKLNKRKRVNYKSQRKRKIHNQDEFSCTKNNINITKKTISLLPFAKRERNISNDNSCNHLKSKKEFHNKEVVQDINVQFSILNFPQTMPSKFFVIQDHNMHECYEPNEMKTLNSKDLVKQKKLNASLDLMKRRDEGLIQVRSIPKMKK